jgi:hypothetical protein
LPARAASELRCWQRPTQEQPQRPQISGGGAGGIEIALPNGARVCVDAFVNEQALSRVLRAMKGTT